MEEAGNNLVPRVDFFGGSHYYTRDADGLYTPPPYLFDELDSNYDLFLVNGPPTVLEDTQHSKDGTVKHFFANVDERACDWMEDRHGNRTTPTYGLTMASGKKLLTRVTDPSGRYLDVSWTNLGTVLLAPSRTASTNPNVRAQLYLQQLRQPELHLRTIGNDYRREKRRHRELRRLCMLGAREATRSPGGGWWRPAPR